MGVGGVWVANTDDHSISNIDPVSRRVVHAIVRRHRRWCRRRLGALWMVDSTRGVASRVDPTFRTVLRTVGWRPPGVRSEPERDRDRRWRDVGRQQRVRGRADRHGGARVRGSMSAMIRAESRSVTGRPGWPMIWTAPCRGSTPPAACRGHPVGPGASGIAVGGGAVWVADTLADTLVRIDPTTDSVTTTIGVGSRPRGVAFGAGGVGGQQRRRDCLARGPEHRPGHRHDPGRPEPPSAGRDPRRGVCVAPGGPLRGPDVGPSRGVAHRAPGTVFID